MPAPRRTDRAAIVSAAITLMDEHGLEDVSLRAIATHLGVRQPALYHHVVSKAALLDAMADEILDRHHTDRLPVEDEPWDEFVARNARSLHHAMLSVRDGARLIASAGSRGPRPDAALTQIALLEGAGFEATEAVLALITVSRYCIGAAIEQQTARDGGDIAIETDHDDDATRRLAAISRDVVSLGPAHEFEVGLAALIRGLTPTPNPRARTAR